jgi:hypothetical protein
MFELRTVADRGCQQGQAGCSGLASRHDSHRLPGFAAADLAFLTGLAAHNDREWFTANRAVYDERLKPTLSALIDALNGAFAARDLPLAGDPKKSVFRIHRDVRFSKDKRPYKTHVSATLTRDGQKLSPGLVYVHIEPEGGPAPAFDPETIDPLDPSTLPSAQAADAAGGGPFAAAGYLTDAPTSTPSAAASPIPRAGRR